MSADKAVNSGISEADGQKVERKDAVIARRLQIGESLSE
jgi:hypothetical protein